MTLTPYGDMLFFYIMFLALIPAIIMGLMQKRIKVYGIFVSLIMLYAFIGSNKIEWLSFIGFYLGELILIKLYCFIRKKTDKRWVMRIAILFSISPLVLVRMSHYFTTHVLGFIGMSYIIFKVVQVILEVYDGLIDNVNIVDFSYFSLFFPTISSGPIDRYRRFLTNVQEVPSRNKYIDEYLGKGLEKIILGIGYKFVISELISNYWMNKIPSVHTFAHVLSYMYAYSFYLFFDFAGYSLMAIGASYILGIKSPDNFNKPFISKDMKEFWNRWHMSLSFWFRDFVYTRFVMQFLKNKTFKSRYTASYVGYFITMITMGIWHGFHLYYLIYGFYEAVVLIGTDYFQRKSKLYKKYKNTTRWKCVSIFATFNIACFGLLLFSGYLFNK